KLPWCRPEVLESRVVSRYRCSAGAANRMQRLSWDDGSAKVRAAPLLLWFFLERSTIRCHRKCLRVARKIPAANRVRKIWRANHSELRAPARPAIILVNPELVPVAVNYPDRRGLNKNPCAAWITRFGLIEGFLDGAGQILLLRCGA